MPTRENNSLADLAAALRREIGRLAPELLPGGVYAAGRRQWRCGSLAGEAGGSLCVWLAEGKWLDYASGEHGDALDLVAAVRGEGTGDACRWAEGWLGGRAAVEARRAAPERDERERREAERLALHQQQDAKRVWLTAAPMVEGDPAWRYLAGRGIDLGGLGLPVRALRCHPGLWNAESGREWPALVAAICGPQGAHLNTHRIWLDERADGSVGKAPLKKPKRSMPGSYAGGCVRLWNGASGKPWRALAEGKTGPETIAAGEGIEDVLSFATLRPDYRCVAVLSVSGLARLVLPDQMKRLLWIAQNDPPGSAAATALARAIDARQAGGVIVDRLWPPVFRKDLSDLVQWWGGIRRGDD